MKIHKPGIFLVLYLLSFQFACFEAHSSVKSIESLGNIWIVTIDKSGSMLYVGNPAVVSRSVTNRLSNNKIIDSIDFKKDRFLFFYSGFRFNSIVGLGNQLRNSPGFETSFIHHTDQNLYQFNDKSELINHTGLLLRTNNYIYNLSFVSQIRVFSIKKAIDFLIQKNENINFKDIIIVTITDDGEQNDQWLTDYRNLKIWAPSKIDEVKKANTRYIYNHLNGIGGGVLDEMFSDERNIPHLWIYSYQTRQSKTYCDTVSIFNIDVSTEKQISLKPKTNLYLNDTVCAFTVDSIKINNSVTKLGNRFEDEWTGGIISENKLRFNKIQIFGSMQIVYTDSIYGRHYKKVRFIQHSKTPSTILSNTFFYLKIILGFIFISFLLYWLILLPNKILFIVYTTKGLKYIVRRGYRQQWKLGDIPVLSKSKNNSYIFKKHKNISVQRFHDLACDNFCFLVQSKYQMFNNSISTEQDIECYFKTNSQNYSGLLKYVYRKKIISKIRSFKEKCSDKYILFRKTAKLFEKLILLFDKKFYYQIPVSENNIIRFISPLLKNRTFIFELNTTSIILTDPDKNINNKINIACLNTYYSPANKYRSNALINYYFDNTESKIYWNILLPEFDRDHKRSLRYIYNIYHFCQKVNGIDHIKSHIDENIIILKQTIRKELKYRCQSNVMMISNIDRVSNDNLFMIESSSIQGFVYLIQDTSEKKYQLLYSPFINGLEKELYINVQKTPNAHLYLTFSKLKYLHFIDNLRKIKLSESIFKFNNASSEKLSVKSDNNEIRITFSNITTKI